MALLDWLRKRLAGDEKAELHLSPEEESLSGLDLRQVMDAHTNWKIRLQDALNGTSKEKFEISAVAQDNLCVLGKWLYGPGKVNHAHLPEYGELRSTHAEFHLTAGEVLLLHQDGDLEAANALLKGKFRHNSNKIQLDLVKLFSAAKHNTTHGERREDPNLFRQ